MLVDLWRGATSSLSDSDRSAKIMFLSGERELKRKTEWRDGEKRKKTRAKRRREQTRREKERGEHRGMEGESKE